MLGINLYTTITIPAWFITCKSRFIYTGGCISFKVQTVLRTEMQSGSLEGAMLLQKVECYTYFIYMNSSVNAELFFREVQLCTYQC